MEGSLKRGSDRLMSALFPAAQTLNFTAPLTGLREVPPVVDTPGTGTVQITVLPGDTGLQVLLTVQNLRQVTQAHIHLGMPGESGPIVVWLFNNPQSIDATQPTVLVNQTFRASDMTGPLAGMNLSALVQEMIRGNTYVNVHTIAHPNGEIRGQLRRG